MKIADDDLPTFAERIGLKLIGDDCPGIRRKKRGRGFSYYFPDGHLLRGADRRRVESLAVPPAWQRVWIAVDDRGHLQATGRDARLRKQYRYHPEWRQAMSAAKFERMADFGRSLPRLRRKVRSTLKLEEISSDVAVAAVVRMLDRGHLRIGNEGYTRENGTFGATTLRPRHVDVDGPHVEISFRGKHGVDREVELHDELLAPVLRQLARSGRRLFSFEDGDGVRRRVTSADVNAWIREHSGGDFSAKDFRTWHGSVDVLARLCDEDGPKPTKRRLSAAIRHAAGELGNTPATCRMHYVHPLVPRAYLGGTLCESMEAAEPIRELRAAECGLVRLLETPPVDAA